MKIIQFAFDSRDESDYLPHTYGRNSIVYTGTHDNDTLVGWFGSMDKADRETALAYINRKVFEDDKDLAFSFIKLAMGSVSKMCIIPMQDWLGLGSKARINIPSTLGGNWTWRMKKGAFTKALANEIHDITKLYARI